MSEKTNLVNSFMKRRMAQIDIQRTNKGAKCSVSDMRLRRQEILESERRMVKRTLLSEFIGVHVIIPGKGLKKVSLYNISKNGLAFEMEEEEGSFLLNEELAMRVYMNNKTYFPFVVKITNIRTISDEKVTRHGAVYAQGSVNDEALGHFVKFIETVNASLVTDAGDIMVSNLGNCQG